MVWVKSYLLRYAVCPSASICFNFSRRSSYTFSSNVKKSPLAGNRALPAHKRITLKRDYKQPRPTSASCHLGTTFFAAPTPRLFSPHHQLSLLLLMYSGTLVHMADDPK